jgi:hypothetical protein
MIVRPGAVELEKAKKKKPKQRMALVETSTGRVRQLERVERFAFSDDSNWLACLHFKEEEKPKEDEKVQEVEKEKSPPEKKSAQKKRKSGSTLFLLHLESGKETGIPHVLSFAFDSSSRFLAYVVADPEGKTNGLYTVDLKKDTLPQNAIVKTEDGVFVGLVWTKKRSKLAFLSKPGETNNKEIKDFSLQENASFLDLNQKNSMRGMKKTKKRRRRRSIFLMLRQSSKRERWMSGTGMILLLFPTRK